MSYLSVNTLETLLEKIGKACGKPQFGHGHSANLSAILRYFQGFSLVVSEFDKRWLQAPTARILIFLGLLMGFSSIGWLTPDGASLAAESDSHLDHVWVNSGEDKVTQDDLRAHHGDLSVRNSIWNGTTIRLFGARNEVVSLNLVLEAVTEDASQVEVVLESLVGPEQTKIAGRASEGGDDLFNFVGRNIELFFVRYVPIRGISILAYDHYDERHIPRRLRRPHNADGHGRGGWRDRPNHDKFYPEIAVPLELHSPFKIRAGTNQSIWIDIYIPKESPPGTYTAAVSIREQGTTTRKLPIQLEVRNFTLPDLPTARTMMYFSPEHVNRRYLGVPYPDDSSDRSLAGKSKVILDRHFQMAHRHKISMIDDYLPIDRMAADWSDRLSGALFTPARGYDGVGVGVGNNVYSIGSYGSWPWKDQGEKAMWGHTDDWVGWFDAQSFTTPTDYFLFLIDESSDFPQIEKWSQWVDRNPGPGRRLPTLATVPAPEAARQAPSLDIPTSTLTVGKTGPWQKAVDQYHSDPNRRLFMYNGFRPASGCLATEDEGVALRQLAWGQYKMQIERWFVWESTYYKNFHAGLGETNVFRQAHTFGGRGKQDKVLGETGWNYNNGDGVLFYPGTDTQFLDESYDVSGPIASLRLKHWRRGLQDVDYLALAAKVDAKRVDKIVRRMVPKILWEHGVDDPGDPTWVRTDISWSIDPDDWEAARRELAEIIERGATGSQP